MFLNALVLTESFPSIIFSFEIGSFADGQMIPGAASPLEDVFEHWRSREPGIWLQKIVMSSAEEKDVDEAELPPCDVQSVCRANEPCASFAECLCENNCADAVVSECCKNAEGDARSCQNNLGAFLEALNKFSLSGGGDHTNWLLESSLPHTTSTSVEQTRLFPEFDKPLEEFTRNANQGCTGDNLETFKQIWAEPLSAWLCDTSQGECCGNEQNEKRDSNFGKMWLSNDVEIVDRGKDEYDALEYKSNQTLWLSSAKLDSEQPDMPYKIERCESNSVLSEDESVWLLRKEGSAEKLDKQLDYDRLFTCFQEKNIDVSQWVAS